MSWKYKLVLDNKRSGTLLDLCGQFQLSEDAAAKSSNALEG